MTDVHVVCGGQSNEREVSLRSGIAVTRALERAGYKVAALDTTTASLDEIANCDVVFPVLHGAGGEDGALQAKLEKRHVRYVGSDAGASALCFDKWQYRRLLTRHKLPMTPAALVQADNYRTHRLATRPYVLKPFDGGSSIDTFIVRGPATAPHDKIVDAFHRHPTMLLEELIIGTELTVGVLGNQALPVIEIVPPQGGEFDYENKYNGATQELCPPQHVSEPVQQAAQKLALQAHQLAGCRDLSRTDIMCQTDGTLYLLETNTLPGMTDQSLYPKMAAAIGLDMPALCARLVEVALSR